MKHNLNVDHIWQNYIDGRWVDNDEKNPIYDAATGKMMRCAQDLRAGQIYVNEWWVGGHETPFGGFKKSGFGREMGIEGMLNYVQTKTVG